MVDILERTKLAEEIQEYDIELGKEFNLSFTLFEDIMIDTNNLTVTPYRSDVENLDVDIPIRGKGSLSKCKAGLKEVCKRSHDLVIKYRRKKLLREIIFKIIFFFLMGGLFIFLLYLNIMGR